MSVIHFTCLRSELFFPLEFIKKLKKNVMAFHSFAFAFLNVPHGADKLLMSFLIIVCLLALQFPDFSIKIHPPQSFMRFTGKFLGFQLGFNELPVNLPLTDSLIPTNEEF